jgi:hypothetical protein
MAKLKVRTPKEIEDYVAKQAPKVKDIIKDRSLREAVGLAIARKLGALTEKERIVLLGRASGRTLESIGNEMGCTKQWISYIEIRANAKLDKSYRGKARANAETEHEYTLMLTPMEKRAIMKSREMRKLAKAGSLYQRRAVLQIIMAITEYDDETTTTHHTR